MPVVSLYCSVHGVQACCEDAAGQVGREGGRDLTSYLILQAPSMA